MRVELSRMCLRVGCQGGRPGRKQGSTALQGLRKVTVKNVGSGMSGAQINQRDARKLKWKEAREGQD